MDIELELEKQRERIEKLEGCVVGLLEHQDGQIKQVVEVLGKLYKTLLSLDFLDQNQEGGLQ